MLWALHLDQGRCISCSSQGRNLPRVEMTTNRYATQPFVLPTAAFLHTQNDTASLLAATELLVFPGSRSIIGGRSSSCPICFWIVTVFIVVLFFFIIINLIAVVGVCLLTDEQTT